MKKLLLLLAVSLQATIVFSQEKNPPKSQEETNVENTTKYLNDMLWRAANNDLTIKDSVFNITYTPFGDYKKLDNAKYEVEITKSSNLLNFNLHYNIKRKKIIVIKKRLFGLWKHKVEIVDDKAISRQAITIQSDIDLRQFSSLTNCSKPHRLDTINSFEDKKDSAKPLRLAYEYAYDKDFVIVEITFKTDIKVFYSIENVIDKVKKIKEGKFSANTVRYILKSDDAENFCKALNFLHDNLVAIDANSVKMIPAAKENLKDLPGK